MPIYVYETIPQNPGDPKSYLEVSQGIHEAALTKHPDTGEPIRRVILGGYGVLTSREPRGYSGSGPCCGSGSDCCG